MSRNKRDTTIIHRVRKRRPKHPPRKKLRRPSSNTRYQPKPIYGSPQYSTSININPPVFTSPDFISPTKNFADSPVSHFATQHLPASTNTAAGSFQNLASHSQSPPHNSINSISSPSQYSVQAASYPPLPPPPPPQTYLPAPLQSNQNQQLNGIHSQNALSFYPVNNPRTILHSRPLRLKRPEPTFSSYSTQGIPLDVGLSNDPYNSQITSYDVPVNSYNSLQNVPTLQIQNSIKGPRPTQYEVQQSSINPNLELTSYSSPVSHLPVLPKHYDQGQFHSIQPIDQSSRNDNNQNSFLNDDSFESYLNDVSESQRINIKTKPKISKATTKPSKSRKEKEKEKDKKTIDFGSFENFSEEFSLETFKNYKPSTSTSSFSTTTSTTTTKRPRTLNSKRRKRPKVSTSTQHILDTEDLKDAFESESEIQEIFLSPDETMEFESKKHYKVDKPTLLDSMKSNKKITTTTNPTNYVLLASQNSESDEDEEFVRVIPKKTYKTEKPTIKMSSYTYKPKRIRRPVHSDSAEEQNEDIDILSIQKSKSKNYYVGSEQENPKTKFQFTLPDNNNEFDVFETGVFVLNNGYGTRVKHGRAKKHLSDRYEDYTFEAEYEIEIPTNFDKK